MKTSSFKFSAHAPGAVSIARKKAWYFHGPEYRPLFPPEDLLRDYGDGLIPWREYEDRYYCAVLGPLDGETVFQELHDLVAPREPILLCWEIPYGRYPGDVRCHRRIFARWLEGKMAVEIPEVGVADALAFGTNAGPLFRK